MGQNFRTFLLQEYTFCFVQYYKQGLSHFAKLQVYAFYAQRSNNKIHWKKI